MNKQLSVMVAATVYPLNTEAPDVIPPDLPPVWGHPELPLGDVILQALEEQKQQQAAESS